MEYGAEEDKAWLIASQDQELVDQAEHLVLGCIVRKCVLHGMKTARFGSTFFVSDIDLACRVFTDDYNRESRAQILCGREIGSGLRNPGSQVGSHCLAVNKSRFAHFFRV